MGRRTNNRTTESKGAESKASAPTEPESKGAPTEGAPSAPSEPESKASAPSAPAPTPDPTPEPESKASESADPSPEGEGAESGGDDPGALGVVLCRPRWYAGRGDFVRNASPTPIIVGVEGGALVLERRPCPEERGAVAGAPTIPERNKRGDLLRTPASMRTESGGARWSAPLARFGINPDDGPARSALVSLVCGLIVGANGRAESAESIRAKASAEREAQALKARGSVLQSLRRALSALSKGPDDPTALASAGLCADNPLNPSEGPAIVGLARRLVGLGLGADGAGLLALSVKARDAFGNTPIAPTLGAVVEALTEGLAREGAESEAPESEGAESAPEGASAE